MTKTDKVIKIVFLILMGILYCFFIRRLFLGMDTTDEIFNITNSYRLISGNRLLVDLWDYYQTGDMFLAPFIWVFWNLTGSLDGIVLACGLFYAVLNLGVAALAYYVLRDYLQNFYARIAVCMGIVFFAPFSLYYLYYDTAGQLFFLTGVLLLLKQLKTDSFVPGVLAGLAHACMVFAYPTAIVIVVVEIVMLLILFGKEKKKKIWNYLLGGGIFILAFLVYGMVVRFDFFFLDNPVSRANQLEDMSGLSTAAGFDKIGMVLSGGNGSIIGKVLSSISSIFETIGLPLLLGGIGLILLILIRKFRIKWLYRGIYILLLLAPIFLFKRFSAEYNRAVILIYVYYCVLLVGALAISPSILKEKKELLLLGIIPSVLLVPIISFTAANGGNKAMFGLFVAGTMGLGIAIEAIESDDFKIKGWLEPLATVMMGCLTVGLFYSQFFQCEYTLKDLTRTADSGIYKGLKITESDLEQLDLEQEIRETVNSADTSVTIIGSNSSYNYLTLGKKVQVSYVAQTYAYCDEAPLDYCALKTYWERFGYPDVLIVCKNAEGYYDEEKIENTPDCNFVRRDETEHFLVYENK